MDYVILNTAMANARQNDERRVLWAPSQQWLKAYWARPRQKTQDGSRDADVRWPTATQDKRRSVGHRRPTSDRVVLRLTVACRRATIEI